MSVTIDWQGGLDDLAREFETLPDRLMAEVIDPVMEAKTAAAEQDIRSAYTHESLSKGVSREKLGPGEYVIKNSSQLAHLHELGTQERQHADGSPTGAMPATPVMIPRAVAAREEIGAAVSEGFQRLRVKHLEVSGA